MLRIQTAFGTVVLILSIVLAAMKQVSDLAQDILVLIWLNISGFIPG